MFRYLENENVMCDGSGLGLDGETLILTPCNLETLTHMETKTN